ncbi:MAG TPA: hypothetical protein VMY35_08015 [Phycisphaerae bacterium]|nr:hypothetical protein [Phycisphaerae bacterium]
MILLYAIADYVARLTGGFWELLATGAPSAPVLAVVNNGDAVSVTATVSGDAGATHTLYYWRAGVSALTTGDSRVGDGDIVQAGLTSGTYHFIAVSDAAGVYSLPSNPVQREVYDATALPIIEVIAAWLLTKLLELKTLGIASEAVRPTRSGIPVRPQDKLLVLYQPDPEEGEQEQGHKVWIQPFAVDCYVRPADASTAAVDATINTLRSRVENKLIADITCNGLAMNVEIRAPQGFQEGEGFEGVRVNFAVTFRHLETDAFTQ